MYVFTQEENKRELTNITPTPVIVGGVVPFTETAVEGGPCIHHREGSGLVTLRGLTNQCRARFLVRFSANIAVPTGGTPEAISLSIALNGEPLQATTTTVTPAAVENFFNVASFAYIDVPKGCCVSVAIENTSGQEITVANSNLIVTREA